MWEPHRWAEVLHEGREAAVGGMSEREARGRDGLHSLEPFSVFLRDRSDYSCLLKRCVRFFWLVTMAFVSK